MRRFFGWMFCAFAVVVVFNAGSVAAEDTKPAKVERTAEQPQSAEDNNKDLGGKFTSFWVNDVGGTIHTGLKRGARKIHNAFTGGSKEKDEEKARLKAAEKKKEEAEKQQTSPSTSPKE